MLLSSLALAGCAPRADDVVLPAELDGFDPALRQLIETKAEAVRSAPLDARAVASLGLVYEAQRLWHEARECFERAHALQPTEARWPQHAALCLHYNGRSDEALAYLRAREATIATDPAALHLFGTLLLCGGEPAAAGEAFRACIERSPGRPEGYVGLGEVELQLGAAQAAANLFEHALAIDDSYASAHYLLGLAYRDLGREPEAKQRLARGAGAPARLMPDPLTEEMLGYLVSRVDRLKDPQRGPGRNRREAAELNASAVLARDPDDVKALLVHAGALLKDGRAAQAFEGLERALALEPENVQALVSQGRALAQLGRPGPAARSLRRAIELDPTFLPALTSLSSVLLQAGRATEALDSARRAVELAPDSADAHATLAMIRMESGQADLARQGFARALELEPQNRQMLEAYGRACAQAGDHEAAHAAFSSLTERAPRYAAGYLYLSRSALALGRRPEAAAHLKAGRELGANGPLVAWLQQALREEATLAGGQRR